MKLSPPRGFLGALLELLERPTTLFVALVAVALAALQGVGSSAAHPLTGPWPQIALALAGFAVAAQALRAWGEGRAPGSTGRGAEPPGGASTLDPRRVGSAVVWCAGLALAAVGAPMASPGAGTVDLGAAPVEAYDQIHEDRPLATHLGAVLERTPESTANALSLRLAMKDRELGRGVLPLDGSAAALVGPWKLKVLERVPAGEGTHVRLKVTPRAGGEALSLRLALGEARTLPGDVRLDVAQISGDFGRALGPAARLTLRWAGQESTDWYFVEAPDLDERVGTSPLVVVLEGVEAEGAVRAVVARRGPTGVLAAGLGLMGVGLLLGLRRRTGAAT